MPRPNPERPSDSRQEQQVSHTPQEREEAETNSGAETEKRCLANRKENITDEDCEQRDVASVRAAGCDDGGDRRKGAMCGSYYGSCSVSPNTAHQHQVNVCQACEHLYTRRGEVIICPASLEHIPAMSQPCSLPHPASPRGIISCHRPWSAQRYEGLCECQAVEVGRACVCGAEGGGGGRGWKASVLQCLPCRTSPWRTCLLVVAGTVPWVFLITYIVLMYT